MLVSLMYLGNVCVGIGAGGGGGMSTTFCGSRGMSYMFMVDWVIDGTMGMRTCLGRTVTVLRAWLTNHRIGHNLFELHDRLLTC